MGGSFSITLEEKETENRVNHSRNDSPDEKCGGDQHHGQVHGDGGLKVESLEVGGGVADTEEEEGGKVGGQQLIDKSPLELDFHLYTLVSSF